MFSYNHDMQRRVNGFYPVESKSRSEGYRRESMGSLIEENIDDFFITGFYAAIDCIKDSAFSSFEDAYTDVIYFEILDETLCRNFEHCLRSEVVENLWSIRFSLILALAHLSLQFSRSLKPMRWRKAQLKSKVVKEIPVLLDCSPLPSGSPSLYEKAKASCLRNKRQKWKDWRHCDNFLKFTTYAGKLSLYSLSFNADQSLTMPVSIACACGSDRSGQGGSWHRYRPCLGESSRETRVCVTDPGSSKKPLQNWRIQKGYEKSFCWTVPELHYTTSRRQQKVFNHRRKCWKVQFLPYKENLSSLHSHQYFLQTCPNLYWNAQRKRNYLQVSISKKMSM